MRGVGRLAHNLALFGGIVGLNVPLGAESPEISSAVSATVNGLASVGMGIVIRQKVGSEHWNVDVSMSSLQRQTSRPSSPPTRHR